VSRGVKKDPLIDFGEERRFISTKPKKGRRRAAEIEGNITRGEEITLG